MAVASRKRENGDGDNGIAFVTASRDDSGGMRISLKCKLESQEARVDQGSGLGT